MHEFSLMADLLKKIEAISKEQDGAPVTRVKVWLGALSHITPEHFAEHFTEGTKGTIANGAKLDVEMSEDTKDPNAQDILLKSIDVKTD
ncbi:MAG: hydrogenase maturation nickel metallochaperone HypA [Alphaproteobacteria bacterium]|nr:hydrogenase maturation nickel metallochaperone HypA [Alphaproteobacteria bacterium]